jgi:protein farnesyltransferase subunit beta
MSFEGGFQGRTHKLVDACYSFWMGGCFPLAQAILYLKLDELSDTQAKIYDHLQWNPEKILNVKPVDQMTTFEELENNFPELLDTEWFFDQTGLQEYLLLCCQYEKGGLRDKPGK